MRRGFGRWFPFGLTTNFSDTGLAEWKCLAIGVEFGLRPGTKIKGFLLRVPLSCAAYNWTVYPALAFAPTAQYEPLSITIRPR
jgi:hypothetical protein